MDYLNEVDLNYLETLNLLSKRSLNLLRVKLAGELKGSFYYVSDADAPLVNPINYGNNPFFLALSKSPIALLETEVQTAIVPTGTKQLGALTTPLSGAVEVSETTNTKLVRKVGKFSLAKAKINVNGELDFTDVVFPLDGANSGWPMVLKTNLQTSSSSHGGWHSWDGRVTSPESMTMTGALLNIVREVDNLGNLDRDIPFWSTSSATKVIKAPALLGYHRLIITDGSSNTFVVYLKGSGKDIVWASVGQGPAGGTDVSYDFDLLPFFCPPTVKPANSTVATYFPLNMPTGLIDQIYGTSDVVELGQDYVGDCAVRVFDCVMDVKKASGHITPEVVLDYWTSGWGVYTPISEDAAYKKLASWNAVLTNGAYYTMQRNDCSKRSLTELTYYKDYVKARRKACKDNNYMSLPFNDEYTMGDVENMLKSLSERSVWVSGQGGIKSVSAPGVSLTVTITNVDEGRFQAKSGDAVNLYQKTEAGVNAFADAYTGYKIVDAGGILEAVASRDATGEGLAALNKALEGIANTATYSLSGGDFVMGTAPTYEELTSRSNDVDSQVAFLVAQITTFAKFNTFITGWLNEFSYDKVSVKLNALGVLKKYESVSK